MSVALRPAWWEEVEALADVLAVVQQLPVAPPTTRPPALTWAHDYAIIHTADGQTLRYHDVARDYQDAILPDQARRVIIAKSRQIGISQVVAFLAAHEARYGGTVLVISRDQDQAAEFLTYVRTALDGDPSCPDRVRDNQYSLTLANAGRIVTQAATSKAGRGTPATLVIIDEMAWQEYADLIYTAVLPTLATTAGRLVVMSTPQGRANRFYQLWQTAQAGASGWSAHFLPWSVHPDWDEAWAEEQRAVLGDAAFAQEHDVDFAVSGLAVFEPGDIAALWRLPAFVAPEPNHRYITAWDIARKRDAFVGFTFDVSTAPFRVVAYERHVRLDYPQQAARIEARHRRYNGIGDDGKRALVCRNTTVVESNGVGDPLIQFLSVKVEEFVTTAKTKRNAIDALRLLLNRRELIAPPIPDWERELTLYQLNDERLMQDTVMASAIAALHAGRPVRPANVAVGGTPTVPPLRFDIHSRR